LVSRNVCLHWLPYWLPKLYLPSLMFEQSEAVSIEQPPRHTACGPNYPLRNAVSSSATGDAYQSADWLGATVLATGS
jgi:hypothetical protein